MIQLEWFIDSPWWWLALWLPTLAFTFSAGSGRKERHP